MLEFLLGLTIAGICIHLLVAYLAFVEDFFDGV